MSATIPENMLLSDLLKATGYDCPDDLQGKSFSQATSGGEAELEANHASTVDVGEYTQPIEITPAEGKDGMEKVTLTLTNIPEEKEEQTKSITITENGTTTVEPDEGKTLSSVSITANVPVRCVLRCYKMTTGTPTASYPEYIYASKVYDTGSLDGEPYYKGTPLSDSNFSDTESYSASNDEISSSFENFTYTRYSAGDIVVTATN